jgi:ArsR family transcriptional regulator
MKFKPESGPRQETSPGAATSKNPVHAAGSSRRFYPYDRDGNAPSSLKAKEVVAALGAIAHDHRLAIYRMLVEAGPQGLPPVRLPSGSKSSSLTFHLQQMLHADLVTQRRLGRQLIYGADYTAMNSLVGYLTENCCGSAADCGPACNPAPAAVKPRKHRRSA